MAAGVFLAPRGCGFEQDCARCSDPEIRTKWACDAPADQPVASIRCFVCKGANDECAHCGGTGEMPVHRCPNKLADERTREVLMAATMVENGVLPEGGGWRDQAATFVQLYPLAMAEVRHWQDVRIEQERKKQKPR